MIVSARSPLDGSSVRKFEPISRKFNGPSTLLPRAVRQRRPGPVRRPQLPADDDRADRPRHTNHHH
jgi:hypothetical protein